MADTATRSSPNYSRAPIGARQGTGNSGTSINPRDSPGLAFGSRGPVVEQDDDEDGPSTATIRKETVESTSSTTRPHGQIVSSPLSEEPAHSSRPPYLSGSQDTTPPKFPGEHGVMPTASISHFERHEHPAGPRQPAPAFRIVGHHEFDEPMALPEANLPLPRPPFLRPPGALSGDSSNRTSNISQTSEQAEEEAERLWKESEELYKAIQGRLGFSDSPTGDDSTNSSTSPTPILPVPGAFPAAFRFGAPENEGERTATRPSFPHAQISSGSTTQKPFVGGFGDLPLEARPSTDTFFTVPSDTHGNETPQLDSGTEADDGDDGGEDTMQFPSALSSSEGPASPSHVGALNVAQPQATVAPEFPTSHTPEPSTHGPIPTVHRPQTKPSIPEPQPHSPTMPVPQSTFTIPKPSATGMPQPQASFSMPTPSSSEGSGSAPPMPKPQSTLSMPKPTSTPGMPKPQSTSSVPTPSGSQGSSATPSLPKPQPAFSIPKPSDPEPTPSIPKPPAGSGASSNTPPPAQPTPQIRPPRPQHVKPTPEPPAAPVNQPQATLPAPSPSPGSQGSVYSQDEAPTPPKPPQFQQQAPPNKPTFATPSNVGGGKPTTFTGTQLSKPPTKPPTPPIAAPPKPPVTHHAPGGSAFTDDVKPPPKPFSSTPSSNSLQSASNGPAAHAPSSKPPKPISEIKPTKPSKPPAVEQSHSESGAIAASNSGGTSPHTRYVNMLLALDDIPNYWNILASFFTWILLAGFLLFPGTFTSWREEQAAAAGAPQGVTDELKGTVLSVVSHVPLFVIAFICSGIGAAGMIWLWWRWMANYIWLLNKVFVPGLLNALAGLLSTLTNIFGAQDGQLSTTALTTLIVTASSSGVLLIMTLFYQFWLLRRVQNEHWQQVGKQKAGRHGEGVLKGMMDSKSKVKQGA